MFSLFLPSTTSNPKHQEEEQADTNSSTDAHDENSYCSGGAQIPLSRSSAGSNAHAASLAMTFKTDPSGRWFAAEYDKLAEMKRRLSSEIEASPPYPDVIGERRMIRFLRGKDGNVDQATKLYGDFLKWRRENGVDEIRDKILYGGVNHPFKFPMGEKIIELQPQIVIAPRAFDNHGQPITLETFGFDPDAVFKHVTIEQYLTFLIYSLEFRALVMEQLSEEREREYLREHLDPSSRQEGYGVLVKQCIIRDLKGISTKHAGQKAQQLIKASLDVAIPNYPEYLGKSHMINAPWIFNALWAFVKGMLDKNILAKISINGENFLAVLAKEIPMESIPVRLGGRLEESNEAFEFDISQTGPFYSPGKPTSHDDPSSCNIAGPAIGEAVAGTGGRLPQDHPRLSAENLEKIPASGGPSPFTIAATAAASHFPQVDFPGMDGPPEASLSKAKLNELKMDELRSKALSSYMRKDPSIQQKYQEQRRRYFRYFGFDTSMADAAEMGASAHGADRKKR